MGDGPDGLLFEIGRLVGGVRQVPGDVDGHLVGVVEGAAQREGLGGGQAEPGLEEVEPRRRADAQGRRGQHAGGDLGEEQVAQAGADVQGRRGQADAEPGLLLDLDPVDGVLGRLADPARDLVGQRPASLLGGRQLDPVLGLLDRPAPLVDGAGQPAQLLAERTRSSRRAAGAGR